MVGAVDSLAPAHSASGLPVFTRTALAIETRSAPALLGATHRAFTFYLGNPISSIETRSAPALTHVLPSIRPVGFPIYVARRLGCSIHSVAAATFTFYLADPSA